MTDEKLLELALDARKNAYVPYSGYAVGAALLTEDGKVFAGCNIENAAYGNTLCAERTALVKAVSEGYRKFTKIAIASSGSAPYPCGACRQSLYEFAPGLEVLVTWDGHVERAPLSELLPHGFGPSSLGKSLGDRWGDCPNPCLGTSPQPPSSLRDEMKKDSSSPEREN